MSGFDRDAVVVGGGASGLSAAVFLARYGFDTVVFDRGTSAIKRCYSLENYLGFLGIRPETFLELGREHVRYEGGDVEDDMVVAVTRREESDGDGTHGETDGDGVHGESDEGTNETGTDVSDTAGADGSDTDEAADGTAGAGDGLGRGFRVRTQDGRELTARFVVAAAAYDGDYLADLADGSFHDEGDHPVDADEDGRTEIDGLYVAGWLSGGPHQVIVAAGHGARVAKSLIADARRDRGYWDGVAQYWDWRVPEGTYGDEEWERAVDEWIDGTVPDDGVPERRVERVREEIKAERLGYHCSEEQRRERLKAGRELLREKLFENERTSGGS